MSTCSGSFRRKFQFLQALTGKKYFWVPQGVDLAKGPVGPSCAHEGLIYLYSRCPL